MPRRLVYVFFAVVIVVTPILVSSWFGLCPQYGDPACPGTARPIDFLPAVRAAPPVLLNLFLAVNLAIPYLYPLSFVGMAMVSWRSAPYLTIVGASFGWVASIAWGFIADELFVWTSMAGRHRDSQIAPLLQANATSWHVTAVGAGWVIGHLFAYIFLGIAFLRIRTLPRWSPILLIVAVPIMGPLAYGLRLGVLQILGYLLVAVVCVPAARSLLAASTE
jgi:hypothetical protein